MIKGLLFDLNGTVIDIFTSETDSQIYRTTANFLDYYGVKISPETLQEEYFSNMKRQKKESFEEFPEFDVVEVFADIIRKYHTGNIPPPDPATAAIVFRAAGRYRLEPYSGVLAVLNQLKLHNLKHGQKKNIQAKPIKKSILHFSYLFVLIHCKDKYKFRIAHQR